MGHGKRSCCSLSRGNPSKTFVDILPLSRSAVVHHLKVLEQAGLLIPHKHGRALSYTLNLACAVHALGQVKTYADELLAATEAAQ